MSSYLSDGILAAIIAIGIDLPASVAMSVALVPTIGIGAAVSHVAKAVSRNVPSQKKAD